MAKAAGRETEAQALAATWVKFRSERGRELDAWLRAERLLAETRVKGLDDFDAGDRLVAAEAALQTAIVDFAAAQVGAGNPTPLAVQILRMAEAALDSARSRRVARARSIRGPGSPQAQPPAPPAQPPHPRRA